MSGVASCTYLSFPPALSGPLNPIANEFYNRISEIINRDLPGLLRSDMRVFFFDVTNISMCISRELRFCMMQFPFGGSQEVVIHIPKKKRCYKISRSENRIEEYILPMSLFFRLSMTPEHSKVSIGLLYSKIARGIVGMGGYKLIRQFDKYVLSISNTDSVPYNFEKEQAVVMITRRDLNERDLHHVTRGIEYQGEFHRQHKVSNLAPTPQLLCEKKHKKYRSGRCLYFEQPRYETNLCRLISDNCQTFLGLDNRESFIRIEFCFQFLRDILETLALMHSDGKLHGDVSEGNILFRHAGEFIEVVLNDTDKMNVQGKDPISPNEYPYWDHTTVNKGWMTNFTDVYGWGMCLGYVLLGRNFPAYYYYPRRIKEEKFIKDLLLQLKFEVNLSLDEDGVSALPQEAFESLGTLKCYLKQVIEWFSQDKGDDDEDVSIFQHILRRVSLYEECAQWLQELVVVSENRCMEAKSFQHAVNMPYDTNRVLSWFEQNILEKWLEISLEDDSSSDS